MRTEVFESYPIATSTVSADLAVAPTATTIERNPVAVYLAGLAPGSRRTMRGGLRAIATMIEPTADELTFPFHMLDHAHAVAVRSRLGARLAPATANRILAALRGVVGAAFRLGLISADHRERTCSIDPVRGSRVVKGRALSQGELRALFEVCDAGAPSGARNAALVGVLYGCGLRRAEAVQLDIDHFDATTGKLVVPGKGNKQRHAYVSNGSRDALGAWLAHRGTEPGPLFMPVNKGGRVIARRMTEQAVAALTTRLAREANVAAFSPHDLRRSMISDMLDAGADIVAVQALAGHSSPAVTAKYDRRGERARRKAAELVHVPFVLNRGPGRVVRSGA
jgi:site-specific recombinase XerD